jgi:TRAP-type C4-dicarboxylate transport system substrate-binding protein
VGVAIIATLAVVVLGLWPTPPASAQEHVLRLHHIQPETSPQHLELLQPWAERVAKASNGRLRIEVSGGMKLGGKPAELVEQVETGKVDLAWAVAGYTPDRFRRLSVFELPWIASSRAAPTSQAMHEFHDTYAREDTSGFHLLAVWSHPSGVILNRETPILMPADAARRTIRAPTAVMRDLLGLVGAKATFVPAPEVRKGFQDGALDGALFVYEVLPTLKLTSQVRYITEFAGHRGFYTSVFLLAMNTKAYRSLDEELRRAIDANSGPALSAEFGRFWDRIEQVGRDDFMGAGGEFTFVKGEAYEAWVEASRPAIEGWKAQVGRDGIDGDKLIAAAQALIVKYTARKYNE